MNCAYTSLEIFFHYLSLSLSLSRPPRVCLCLIVATQNAINFAVSRLRTIYNELEIWQPQSKNNNHRNQLFNMKQLCAYEILVTSNLINTKWHGT